MLLASILFLSIKPPWRYSLEIQEREKLSRFLQQLLQARLVSKDGEADRLIQEACQSQPDALYLLVQRSLLLEQALENAEAEIARLRRERENAASRPGGFLDNNAWGNTGNVDTFAPRAATAPSVAPPNFAAPASLPGSPSFFNPGLLGTVASTAAGVVAGSFLFQGIEHLIGGRPASSGFLSGETPRHPVASPEMPATDDNHPLADDAVDDLDALLPGDNDPDWV
jgi:hypothetical protein